MNILNFLDKVRMRRILTRKVNTSITLSIETDKIIEEDIDKLKKHISADVNRSNYIESLILLAHENLEELILSNHITNGKAVTEGEK